MGRRNELEELSCRHHWRQSGSELAEVLFHLHLGGLLEDGAARQVRQPLHPGGPMLGAHQFAALVHGLLLGRRLSVVFDAVAGIQMTRPMFIARCVMIISARWWSLINPRPSSCCCCCRSCGCILWFHNVKVLRQRAIFFDHIVRECFLQIVGPLSGQQNANRRPFRFARRGGRLCDYHLKRESLLLIVVGVIEFEHLCASHSGSGGQIVAGSQRRVARGQYKLHCRATAK